MPLTLDTRPTAPAKQVTLTLDGKPVEVDIHQERPDSAFNPLGLTREGKPVRPGVQREGKVRVVLKQPVEVEAGQVLEFRTAN